MLMNLFKTAVLVMLASCFGGCVSAPPETHLLAAKDMHSVQLAADIQGSPASTVGWPDTKWWTRYNDPQLDALMEQALTSSPSLEAGAARVASAESALMIDQASQGVGIGLTGGANRQRYSANGLFPEPIGGHYFSEETILLQARYDFDWWGERKAKIASAIGITKAKRAEYAQARHSLAAAIAQNYFNWQNGSARVGLIKAMIETQNQLLATQSKRALHGFGTNEERREAEIRLSELNGQAAQLQTYTLREREALRALIGASNDDLAHLQPKTYADISHAMPTDLGIELLARRPDLQAQRWRVEASLNRVEAAQAAFYPDINLMGSIGLNAVSPDKLFESGSRTLFAGSTLTVPLFNSKTLKGRLGIARSDRNEIIADYNQSVFDAVRDVAQAAASLRGIETQMQQHALAEQAVVAVKQSVTAKLQQGFADREQSLTAELNLLHQRDLGLQLSHQQFQAEIALMKALGGGYRSDDNATQAQATSQNLSETKNAVMEHLQ